ncbi:hypothetical protein [Pseudomonas protegens]
MLANRSDSLAGAAARLMMNVDTVSCHSSKLCRLPRISKASSSAFETISDRFLGADPIEQRLLLGALVLLQFRVALSHGLPIQFRWPARYQVVYL